MTILISGVLIPIIFPNPICIGYIWVFFKSENRLKWEKQSGGKIRATLLNFSI